MPDTYDPSAWSVIAGFAAFFAIVFLLTCAWLATVRRFQTPASARPAAQPPRAEAGPKCVACGKPAAKAVRAGLDTWLLCGRCREEVDALTSDLERNLANGDGAA